MTEYFELGPNETNSLESWNHFRWYLDEVEELVMQQTNLRDLQTFAKALAKEGNALRDQRLLMGSSPANLFRTHYSVGFCRAIVQPGDMIFAIDGVRVPLILRRHDGTSSGYRVVGECYLWAALELDYWNPGTKKGIWSSRPYDLGQVQTRMIEIY